MLDEIGKNHAVASGLARADGVEKTHDNDGNFLFFPVGEREEFVESFRGGVAPAAFRSGAENEISFLTERNLSAFTIDLGSRGGNHELALFRGGFEDELRAVDVGFDGADRTFDNEADTYGRGKMNDDVGVVHKLCNKLAIFYGVEVIFEVPGVFEGPDVFHAAGRKIVEKHDAIAALEQPFRQMRADETGAAGN